VKVGLYYYPFSAFISGLPNRRPPPRGGPPRHLRRSPRDLPLRVRPRRQGRVPFSPVHLTDCYIRPGTICQERETRIEKGCKGQHYGICGKRHGEKVGLTACVRKCRCLAMF
jgi:hypothetical protein